MPGGVEEVAVPGAVRVEAIGPDGLPVFLALGLLPAGLLPVLLGGLGWAFGAVGLLAGVVHLGIAIRARRTVGRAGEGSPARRTAAHLGILGLAALADATVLGSAGLPVETLPHLHAVLNAWALVSLAGGVALIRRGRRKAHRACMLSAAAASAVFLVSYVVYHARVGSVPFDGEGLVRTIYLAVLATHVVLSVAVVPAVLVTLTRALGGREDAHRRVARWTYPVWIYVSVTGLIVYGAVHGR